MAKRGKTKISVRQTFLSSLANRETGDPVLLASTQTKAYDDDDDDDDTFA